MLTYPHFPARTTHDLSGVWDFAFLGDSDLDKLDPSNIRFADKMAVPGVFDATPAYAGKRGVACYRTVVPATPGLRRGHPVRRMRIQHARVRGRG
jgi:beta-glucuronidase